MEEGIIKVNLEEKETTQGTQYFVNYVKQRINNNKNFLCCITGQTGSGKSYAAITLMALLRDGELDINNVFLKSKDFIKFLVSDKNKRGVVLLWDEAGVDLNSKSWMSTTNKVINLVMQVFRKENVIVIFTVPYFSFLDSDTRKLVHCVIETGSIDFQKQTTKLKPKLIQVSQRSGKAYYKFLRVKRYRGGMVPVKAITVFKPPEDFLVMYEDKKNVFAKDLYTDVFNTLEKLEEKKGGKAKKMMDLQARIAGKLTEEGKTQGEIANILGKTQQYVAELMKLNQNPLENSLI